MGYYSIFKIIRQIIKDLFGYKIFRKILIILIIAIIFIFIYSKVFASYDLTGSDNLTYKLPDQFSNYNYVVVIKPTRSWDFTFIYGSNTPFVVSNNSTTSSFNLGFSTSNVPYIYAQKANANTTDLSNFTTNVATSGNVTNDFYSISGEQTFKEIVVTNFNLKKVNGETFMSNTNISYPILTNTQTELENLSFNNFNVECQSYSNEDVYMLFYNRSLSNSQTTDGLYPISEKLLAPQSIYYDVENSTPDNAKYTVPIWKTGVLFNIGSTYEIRFATLGYNSEYDTTTYNYIGDTYQFTISSNVTQDYINNLNSQTATNTEDDNFNNLNNSINNTTNAINNQTQSIDNINNSITDSNVDSSSIDLPTDNTSDPTQNGVDNIFQTIYNSFTSGTAQDIVFPIPFTNKSITLQANYLQNVLQNNNASWIITIIQAFWWYLISRFIIKDIMKKIRLIKQGNFDNVQNDNIKEDML